MASAEHVVHLAKGEVGYTEQRTNLTKYGRWYGLDGLSWCAMFISYVFWSAGLPQPATTRKGFASCELGLRWYRGMGTYTKTGSGRFLVGDIVFYQFDADAMADHVGIIVETKKDSIVAVEGNTSATNRGSQRDGGGVHLRERPLKLILGVGRPLYSAAAPMPSPVPTHAPAWPGRFLTLTTPHTKGADVKKLQQRLNTFGGTPLPVDGDFGQKTYDRVRWWQAGFALEVDGVVGRETWAAFFS
jgi:hypothetical protein